MQEQEERRGLNKFLQKKGNWTQNFLPLFVAIIHCLLGKGKTNVLSKAIHLAAKYDHFNLRNYGLARKVNYFKIQKTRPSWFKHFFR